jgi:hypothetical protein
MADLHSEFSKYHDRIALTDGIKITLRTSRDAIRGRICRYFRNTLKIEAPKFRGQGAYAMNTAVNPVNGEYGIEDGVYFQHLDNKNDGDWPTPDTSHHWLINATAGYSSEKPVGNRAFVSVRIAGLFHIDLYAYGELNGKYLLAAKGKAKWRSSNPAAFINWLDSYVHQRGEQLRRIMRYLNAWIDYRSVRCARQAGGTIPMVLAVHHYRAHARDDIAMTKTIEAISDAVRSEFFVLNPVEISEELTAGLTAAQKEGFKEAVQAFSDIANGALAIKDGYKASKLWRKLLGDRFPLGPARR